MRQVEFERVCKKLSKLCVGLYLSLDKNELKNKHKLLRYATIFDNLGKIKLRDVNVLEDER